MVVVYDGSETTKAVTTLVHLSLKGATQTVYALPCTSFTQSTIRTVKMKEKRNFMIESARFSRGQVNDLAELDSWKYEAMIISVRVTVSVQQKPL